MYIVSFYVHEQQQQQTTHLMLNLPKSKTRKNEEKKTS